MSDSGDSPLVINPMISVQFRKTGALLMDTANGECFELNLVGAQVWESLQRGESIADAVSGVADKYKIPVERASADVGALVARLIAHGILRPAGR